MSRFEAIKRLGKKPPPPKNAEEHRKRVERYRSWTSGPINRFVGYIFQVVGVGFITGFAQLFNKVKVLDRHKIKDNHPPYLFITNHLTMFDDIFLGGLLFLPYAIYDNRFFPFHAPEEQNFFLGPIITFILTRSRCVPLTRGHGVFQPGMTYLRELLETTGIVQIYPEGTRSRTGDINKGKVGVGRLAYQTKVKIVPAYHEGTQDILPIGAHRLKTGKKMSVIVGDPIDMSDLYAMKESRDTYQMIADRMVNALRDLRQQLHDRGHGVHPIPSSNA